MNNTNGETVDGFVIYYRLTLSKMNFSAITVPNLRYPPIDTYTISSIEPNQEYELRMTTYSNRGLSPMSNSIKISVPNRKFDLKLFSLSYNINFLTLAQRSSHINSPPTLDEILENITKIQSPSRVKSDFLSTPSSTIQKNSDILYLIIGIIAGILLILMIILIAMCILRLLQRKKFLAHVKSVNNSEYYCDGLHQNLNPDYATSPCLQHGVVSVDGKLIPFIYPTNTKSSKIYSHGLTRNENNTIHLNTNPIDHLDNENMQENFYHTLTPFSTHSQYEECPVHHHHLINYSSDTLPLKISPNNNLDPSQTPSHLHYHPHHHHTCQRQYKTKGIITPKGLKFINKIIFFKFKLNS